jgi:transposase
MKVTAVAETVKMDQAMDVCVDVHKDTLNTFFEAGNKEFEDEFANKTPKIEKKLIEYHQIALEHGYERLRVICEPTGQYQNKLLRAARRLGHLTVYVNAESVAKFRVVETNDSGKTDTKDPRVLRTLGRLGKTLKHRILPEDYLVLRKLGMVHDETDKKIVRTRCQIDRVLLELFCDYSFKKDFRYGRTGRFLVQQYGANPYNIVRTGYKRFAKTMKANVPRVWQKTIDRLWRDAHSSVRNELPEGYIEVLEMHLRALWSDFERYEERKAMLETKMVEILERLRKDDHNIPPPTKGVISAKNLAILLGQTGPISDFETWRKIMRFAGLNIRMRQSGKYEGQFKITKKGRPLLRKVLGQIALPLCKRGTLYGDYYHRKKDIQKMPGNKAMTIVMRHFLRKFYGWYMSGQAFDREHWFTCHGDMMKKAA